MINAWRPDDGAGDGTVGLATEDPQAPRLTLRHLRPPPRLTCGLVEIPRNSLATRGKWERRFGICGVLLVPNLNWEVRHRFTELEGRDNRFLNLGFTDYYIDRAVQTIRFRLDRSGAELASEVQHFCKPSATHFVCDRPFLIVVKKRAAKRPFFVMWVHNAELLCKP